MLLTYSAPNENFRIVLFRDRLMEGMAIEHTWPPRTWECFFRGKNHFRRADTIFIRLVWEQEKPFKPLVAYLRPDRNTPRILRFNGRIKAI